ncbi:hypothetical protein [Chryseobacterium sp. sg2396]|uniref:hypothetical protein n=1 Tax=Chryseobacterium sp. sg2396 TaxID=3276280 RepID=UPI0036706E75
MKKILFARLFISNLLFVFAQNKAVMEVNYETKMISDSLNRHKVNIYASTLLCNNIESAYFSREAQAFYQQNSKETITTSAGAIPKYPKSVGSVYKTKENV